MHDAQFQISCILHSRPSFANSKDPCLRTGNYQTPEDYHKHARKVVSYMRALTLAFAVSKKNTIFFTSSWLIARSATAICVLQG
jgi:hypothetical protein